MRPRSPKQIAEDAEKAGATDLDALEKAFATKRNIPRHLRRQLAETSGQKVIDFVRDTMNGKQTFKVTNPVTGKQNAVPANANTRLRAALTLGVWMGFDAALDEDGERIVPNVIVLPLMATGRDPELEYIEEEMEAEAPDIQAQLASEIAARSKVQTPPTIDPDKVRAIIARRKKGVDSKEA